jgi:hypothetical protein
MVLRQLKWSPNLNEIPIVLEEERIVTRNSKLFAAVMSVGIFAIPCAVRATELFEDNFTSDTDVFSYPDVNNSHLPSVTNPGPGSWLLTDVNSSQIQAGVITNTLPGGGTGGADGNTHYMALQRSGGQGNADAVFSSPAGTTGTLSVQWDMYGIAPSSGHNNWEIFLSDTANANGNEGPLIEASDYAAPSSTDMEIGALTTPSGTYNDLGGFPDNAWIHMDMEVNLSAETYQLFVNNTLVAQPNSGTTTWGYLNSGTVGPFKSLDFYGASNAGETLYVDNVNVDYTPVGGPPQWVPNGSGDWNVATNWNGGVVPNAVDAEADFFGAINANHTVYTDTAVTVGTINFNNAYTYVVTGAGSLTLQTSTGNAQVIVQQGTQELNIPTTIASNTVFNVAAGANLIVANPLTINSGESLTQTGNGTVTYQSIVTVNSNGSIAFADSTHAHELSLASGATATLGGPVLEVDSLSNLGTINLLNNKMLINYGSGPDPIASVEQWIKNGADSLAGPAIISSDIAVDDALSGLSYGIGYADSADPGDPANLPSGTIEVMFTLLGDANLDGTVNSEDFTPFSHNLGLSGAVWDQGDFNYDGTVNAEDFTSFSHNLNQSAVLAGGLEEANGISLANVPEPASMGLLLSATIGFLGLRGRRVASK